MFVSFSACRIAMSGHCFAFSPAHTGDAVRIRADAVPTVPTSEAAAAPLTCCKWFCSAQLGREAAAPPVRRLGSKNKNESGANGRVSVLGQSACRDSHTEISGSNKEVAHSRDLLLRRLACALRKRFGAHDAAGCRVLSG